MSAGRLEAVSGIELARKIVSEDYYQKSMSNVTERETLRSGICVEVLVKSEQDVCKVFVSVETKGHTEHSLEQWNIRAALCSLQNRKLPMRLECDCSAAGDRVCVKVCAAICASFSTLPTASQEPHVMRTH